MVWTLPNKNLLVNKVKAISFNGIIVLKPSLCHDLNQSINQKLSRMFLALWSRKKTLARYLPVHCKLHINTDMYFNVSFGFFTLERQDENIYLFSNLIILLAKYFIHKCQATKVIPHFPTFKKILRIILNPPPGSSKLSLWCCCEDCYMWVFYTIFISSLFIMFYSFLDSNAVFGHPWTPGFSSWKNIYSFLCSV